MSQTTFFEKCIIIGEVFVEMREYSTVDDGWYDFFEINNYGLPMACFIAEGLMKPTGTGEAIKYIEETWINLCKSLNIDPEGKYTSLKEVFAVSPNAPAYLSE
jgi:hypothetical protein